MSLNLREKQSLFTHMVAYLINHVYDNGYELTFGECYRSPEEAARLAKLGLGIKASLHTQRLAIDLNLFKDGKLLTKTEDYKVFGEYWKSFSTGTINCCWGGDFSKPDGNHFSVEHNGRK